MTETIKSDKELRGLALPALRDGGGYFASANKYDVAWSDLMVAILTPIGGRPMQRDFGSALRTVLMELADEQTTTRVNYVITEAVARWCPHIRLLGLATLIKGKSIQIQILFSLVADAQKIEGTITVDRSGPLKAATTTRFTL